MSFTPVPRWRTSADPTDGEGEHAVEAAGLGAPCRRLAAALSVPLGAVLLAAHARVLASLTGQPDVLTGYRPEAGAAGPLVCRLECAAGSWRDLVLAAAGAGAPVFRDAPPLFDAVLDLGRDAGPLDPGTVLAARFTLTGDDLRLIVRHRREALNGDLAARCAGYLLRALQLMTDDPAGGVDASLLSDAERRFQVEGLAGPRRELPDRRFHELFEERARQHPDAVAAQHRGRELTYGELNRRANRIAHALLARGAGSEDVVAVVAERDLDWMAAVVGVLKAGCAYLPVEPRFPPDRVGTMLSRSGCRLALAGPGAGDALRQAAAALGGTAVLAIDALAATGADTDPGVAVAADQLAYVFFTSGSTGEPKGAMVEHAGMLNHLLAKVEDMAIGPGQVVAQTAPQCFDISVWQLLAAPLAGGRTLLVEQAVLLQVDRFVDALAAGRVAVLQLVPSHLDVVLSHLEDRPRSLPCLRRVSVTGEAVGHRLVERWFACQPDVPLVNAYGLTETSDDTNHEVMVRPPEPGHVPVGRPVRNVRVGVVDERLAPVPLGAPGEIVFGGVCVGRGYINDERRTRLAFAPDPDRPGERTYRSGDVGRWLPDGRLEFLGRRDAQVKVRGFRIEIGEVEHRLARMDGLRECAVVVADDGAQSRKLVAFYTGPGRLAAESLRAFLGASLPDYMIPSRFCWLPELPLTGNGKTDRKRLERLATELGPGDGWAAPESPTERWIAAAFADVLGVDGGRVGRGDDFFERGGTSLSAVRLVIRLDRRVTLEELVEHPVLADLARVLDARPAVRP